MQITDEQQYQDAMTELKLLQDAPADDEKAIQRRHELEAAAAQYTELLKGTEPRKGRPDPL